MPRVSFSSDYLLGSPYRTFDSLNNRSDRYYQIPSLFPNESSILSPNDINEILSHKLYEQLNAASRLEKGFVRIESNSKQNSPLNVSSPSITAPIDPELIVLIDRFFHLTYQNTIPMVNLLATAVATHFLQENIRELDKKLQEQQATHASVQIKRGISLLHESDNDEDDDNLSWVSAPT